MIEPTDTKDDEIECILVNAESDDDFDLVIAKERRRETQEIELQISDLMEIQTNINKLTNAQGEDLVHIDDGLEFSKQDFEDALKYLRNAEDEDETLGIGKLITVTGSLVGLVTVGCIASWWLKKKDKELQP